VLRWLIQSNIDIACIDPGKPWQNGSNESFIDAAAADDATGVPQIPRFPRPDTQIRACTGDERAHVDAQVSLM